jgi:hypothetical protein
MKIRKKEKEGKLVVFISKTKETDGGFTTLVDTMGDSDLITDLKITLLENILEDMKRGLK